MLLGAEVPYWWIGGLLKFWDESWQLGKVTIPCSKQNKWSSFLYDLSKNPICNIFGWKWIFLLNCHSGSLAEFEKIVLQLCYPQKLNNVETFKWLFSKHSVENWRASCKNEIKFEWKVFWGLWGYRYVSGKLLELSFLFCKFENLHIP